MSTTGYGPPIRIDGPPPLPPRYGLVPSCPIVSPPVGPDGAEDIHWLNGAAVYPWPADCAESFDQCGRTTSGELPRTINDSKAAGGSVPLPIFAAFPVYEPITCDAKTVGPDANTWFENRAKVALAAVESAAVEAEFCSGGHLPLNPHLCDPNLVVLNSGAAVAPLEALALLESAIAATCRQGVIHVDSSTATYWASMYLVHDENGKLRTSLGTLVVVGDGYLGAVPEGNGFTPSPLAPCTSWAFATGPVQITRGEIFTTPDNYSEALDRTHNVVTFRAERYYLAVWDTVLQAGVLIDRDLLGCGLSNGGS